MANVNGSPEVAETPSKEQHVNGQVEPKDEEGANGQLPDSMYPWSLAFTKMTLNTSQTSSKSRLSFHTSPLKCP
jgi:hypothetical protein